MSEQPLPPSGEDAEGARFDSYAAEYDAALAKGISVSGEDKNYFALGRVKWLSRRLTEISFSAASALDYGCGTGSATPFLLDELGLQKLTGVDISRASLEIARGQYSESGKATFQTIADFTPRADFDLAFCNGVFHHIFPDARVEALDCVFNALRPGGIFAFWENNPWNPGTRWVMSRCPFDDDAMPIAPPAARRLLQGAKFEILRTDFMFIYPRVLKALRPTEAVLAPLPLGTQYMVLARKPI